MHRKKQVAAALLVTLLALALIRFIQAPQSEDRIVTRIIDGDTIVVEGGETIRLLDIDTPERGEPCYTEAKNRLVKLIDGKEVQLEPNGRENRDRYNRLLRYIFHNDTLINLVLVREGLANLYIVHKDTPYYAQFIEAEQLAKQENGCVWK